MKNIDPKILERIKKLLNTANGTDFEGEAATALKMAQDYMTKYGVSLNDVELAEELGEEIVKEEVGEEDNFRSKNPERWSMYLAMAVAIVFDCKAFQSMHYKRSSVTFVGYKSDVKMAKLVFVCLYVVVRAAAVKNIKEAGRPRLSFMLGVAYRLIERAKEEKDSSEKEPTGRFALVVRTKVQNIQDWEKKHVNAVKASASKARIDPFAFCAGKSHGDKIDLMNREKVKQQPQGALPYGN